MEFKAVQKGYQLSLADQREQTIFNKHIPQRTVPVEMQQSLEELFSSLSKQNAKSAEDMLNDTETKQETEENRRKGLWQLLGNKEGR